MSSLPVCSQFAHVALQIMKSCTNECVFHPSWRGGVVLPLVLSGGNVLTRRFVFSLTRVFPYRQDDGSWPVPPRDAQVKSFNPKMMEGRWYISAGLNPAFDCFDCQVGARPDASLRILQATRGMTYVLLEYIIWMGFGVGSLP